MSWRNILSGVIPFYGNDNGFDLRSFSLGGTKSNSMDSDLVHWLYTWDQATPKMRETTHFAKTIGHFRFTDVVGHPWCNHGYGDAMTVVVSQLMKSEVAVMLSNAASNIDNRTDGLIWDETQGRFVISNTVNKTAEDDFSDGSDKDVDAGVIMPLVASIITKFFDDTSIGNKMRSVTDMICQLSDAEFEAKVFDDSVYFCYVEDIVAATLICGESEQSVDCPKSISEYAHTNEDFPSEPCIVANHTLHHNSMPPKFSFNDDELIVPLLMVDLLQSTNEKKLPRFIPTSVSLQESLTYLLLYRSNIIAASYSRQPYLCGADQVLAPTLIPGWNLPLVLTMMPEGDPIFSAPSSENEFFATKKSHLINDAVPLVFVSQSTMSPCSFVITIRGTATMVEWIQDFEYGQTPFFADNRIRTHVGFTRILSSILPPLELFLAAQSAAHACDCRNTHIFVTGHSLGAGVAQLVALHLALRYKYPIRSAYTARAASFSKNPPTYSQRPANWALGADQSASMQPPFGRRLGAGDSDCPIDISAVVFAPPRVFNSYGAEQYRKLINGRVIIDSGDGLAYMPCYEGNSKSGWPRCGPDHMIRTSGRGRDHYADNFGIVEIDVEYTHKRGGKTIDTVMQEVFPSGTGGNEPSVLSTLFGQLIEAGIPGLGRIPSLGALGASHVCSPACKFSQAACGSHFRWWCDKCPMLI